ncbi:hypothetical protein AB0N05_30415 [Nocardia sp. NPDC051030]|uniref:hypothetical protein n=1 Tax=Nocardia sp. NPDC051030 TaxID=3155162 RepID=UPI003429CB86
MTDQRFLYWAYFFGGDTQRPYRVEFGPGCDGTGFYTRYEGDRVTGLIRYDLQAGGGPSGARLDRDGRWYADERPERNVWRGSDYGDSVPPEQACEIAVALGHDPAVMNDFTVHPRKT